MMRANRSISATRTKGGLDALAATAGIGSSRLAQLESGRREAVPDELERLAQALGTQVDDLSDPSIR